MSRDLDKAIQLIQEVKDYINNQASASSTSSMSKPLQQQKVEFIDLVDNESLTKPQRAPLAQRPVQPNPRVANAAHVLARSGLSIRPAQSPKAARSIHQDVTIRPVSSLNRYICTNRPASRQPSVLKRTLTPKEVTDEQQSKNTNINYIGTPATISLRARNSAQFAGKAGAKLLVLHQDGTQQLVEFTFPNKPLTIKEIFDEVGFDSHEKVVCVQINEAQSCVDYVVKYGSLTSQPDIAEMTRMAEIAINAIKQKKEEEAGTVEMSPANPQNE